METKMQSTNNLIFSKFNNIIKSQFQPLIVMTKQLINTSEKYDINKQKEIHYIMLDTVNDAYDTIENLLSWATIQTNTIELNLEKINLNFFINNMIKDLEDRAERKSIKIISSIGQHSSMVAADWKLLGIIFRNLIVNAITYSRTNTEITITTELVKTDISGPYIKIKVIDSGIGMDCEKLKKVFAEPVSYMEQTVGVGLMITKAYVELMGGSIWVYSKSNDGSAFAFSLKPA
jgi:signal transduction histidine kinase